MTSVPIDQLDQLTREELIALLKALLPEIESLRQRVANLETENERLKQQLTGSPNSRNSSQPPSRDLKVNQPKKKRRKHGPPSGHQKYSRPLVENPDRVIQVPVTECEKCLADLTKIAPEDFERRQITELPQAKPLVIETRQHRMTCPHCLTLNRGRLPEGLEAGRCFGPNLEATVVFYKQTQHLSCERIVQTMRDLHGVDLSEGAIVSILERAGELAKPVAESIKEQVISGQAVRSDETSARVKASNWWQWVFISEQGVYHHIGPTRSAAEIKQVFGDRTVETWVSDCLKSQLKAPAKQFQLCLSHQLRDLERVIELFPRQSWAVEMKRLFQQAIHLRNRFDRKETLTLSGYLRRAFQLEDQLDHQLSQPVFNDLARNLKERFLLHRDKLLVFLHDPNVPPTNNESERALRTSVIHRKVTNGFRSEWGARAYAALQSIIATSQLKGHDIFEALVKLMGSPIDHYLQSSSP